MLTRDKILKCEDRKYEDVVIPEWGDTVRVAEMGAHERDEFEQFLAIQNQIAKKDKGRYPRVRAALAAATMVDEKFNTIFTMADVDELGRKSGTALDRIFDVANRLNKIFGDEKEEVKKKSSQESQQKSDGE